MDEMIDRMDKLPRSKAICGAMMSPEFDPVPVHLADDVTGQVHTSLSWMAASMDYRRQESGLEAEPQSPEMKLVHELLEDFAAGRIRCTKRRE